MHKKDKFRQLALAVIETEEAAISALKSRIDDHFANACNLILACKGRTVVIGMGKSGHIANKIAATLASTGTPAFFVHPGEANHGDMGMITQSDVALLISYSGKTPEIMTLLPFLKRFNIPVIAITGHPDSPIAQAASAHIDASISREACPLNLAPTSSTTTALVMGDALAVALLDARGFTKEDFALSHPGGNLGRRLLLHVSDIMLTGDNIPRVNPATSLYEATFEMSTKHLGMTAIIDPTTQKLLGVFTDGDLRRAIDNQCDMKKTRIADVMTPHAVTAKADMLAAESANLLEKHQITALLVTDDNEQVVGAFNIHHLLRAGVL
jgi:arabinose-5-phosphate isomerase